MSSSPRNLRNRSGILLVATIVALATTWYFQFVEFRFGGKKSSGGSGTSVAKDVDETLLLELEQREETVAKREEAVAIKEKAFDNMEKSSSSITSSSTMTEVKTAPLEASSNIVPSSQNISSSYNLSPIHWTQIQNYRDGKALIVNIHATHHAGTTFCATIGRHGINGGIAPKFACMGDKDKVMPKPTCKNKDKNNTSCSCAPYCYSYDTMKRSKNPWKKKETKPFVEAIRPYFHMISWEYGGTRFTQNGRTLDDPDWDYPNLVSVCITRDPISRLLAGGGHVKRLYPGYNTKGLNRKKWFDYALYDNKEWTNNFFLRILTGDKPPSLTPQQKSITNHIETGIERTTNELLQLFPTGLEESNFEHAKALLNKFTIVLDIACLNEGLEALADLLGIQLPPKEDMRRILLEEEEQQQLLDYQQQQRNRRDLGHKMRTHEDPKDRIGSEQERFEDVYEYLVAKNHWDIALYNYSKTISLVRCKH